MTSAGATVSGLQRRTVALVGPAGISLLVIVPIVVPGFFAADNITNVLRLSSILGIVTLGQALVMLVAGIDLSVSAIMSGVLVVIASLVGRMGVPTGLAVLIALAAGAAVGLISGLLVAYRGVTPFVATLAMAAVVAGIQLAATRGAPPGNIPDDLRALTLGGVGPIPFSAFLWLALAAILVVVHRGTAIGRRVRAVGLAPRVAVRSGTPAKRIVSAMYVLSGLLAAVAGVVLASHVGYVDGKSGLGYDLDSIAAAAIGGVAFTGGRGGLIGATLGALALTVVLNLVTLTGLDPNVQYIARGAIILVAVAVLAWRHNITRKG
ncbi:ABC transporter permease [Agromyces bauzanensis]